MAGGIAGSEDRTRTLPRLFGVQYECPTDNAGCKLPAPCHGVAGGQHQLKVTGGEFGCRPDMGDRFHTTIGKLAALAKQPLQQPFRVRSVGQADVAGCQGPDRPRMRVVHEALANARAVDDRGDSDAAEMVCRADARQLQHVRRAEGACADDDLAVGEGLLCPATMAVLDTDRTSIADDHPAYLGLGHHRQVLLAFEVAARRVPALTAVDGGRRDRRTVEFGSTDVIVGSDTYRTSRGDEPRRQLVGIRHAADAHRTLFDPREHRSHVFPRPAGQLPAVVVEVAALHPHHGVHRAGATEHTTGVQGNPSVGTTRLWIAFV